MKILWAPVAALFLLVVAAQPAAAATVITPCQGTCGNFQTFDASSGKKGADCVYFQTGGYYLNKITIRPPRMYGHYSSKTMVGWRFRIQYVDVSVSSTWATVYTSSYQVAQASKSEPADVGGGFARRVWNAPVAGAIRQLSPTDQRYRVLIDMRWWHGSAIDGNASVRYDWYLTIEASNTGTNQGFCAGTFIF